MGSITCRYCQFYAPSLDTPIFGDCAGVFPPKRVPAINPECPYHGDEGEIGKIAEARGFNGHDLRRLEYYAVSEFGIRTRTYSSLEHLLNDIEPTGLEYLVYVCYIDADRRTFYRAVMHADELARSDLLALPEDA